MDEGVAPLWRIIQGDSVSVVRIIHHETGDMLETADPIHVVTDPPYGIGLDYGEKKDDWRPGADFWRDLRTICPRGSTLHMTVSNRHLPEWIDAVRAGGWHYEHCSVYWNRRRAGGNANGRFAFAWEPLLSFSRDGEPIVLPKRMLSDVFQHTGKTETEHPAERDLGAWRAFMSHLPPGLIFDPFAGSGTTLRAAVDLGRKCLGIEINPDFVRLIEARCSQESLFSGDWSSPPNAEGNLVLGETHTDQDDSGHDGRHRDVPADGRDGNDSE